MTTLSKDQIDAISDVLVAKHAKQVPLRHFFIGSVHPLYRFHELAALPPREQIRVVQTAGRMADGQPAVLLSFFLYILAILLAAFITPPEFQLAPVFLAIFVFSGIPAILVRRATVHRYVLTILAHR